MNRSNSRSFVRRIRAVVALSALLGFALWIGFDMGAGATTAVFKDGLPNNHPEKNPGGKAATFSTQGYVNLTGKYFQALGSNGRSCETCHAIEDAWSVTPARLQDLFDDTDGLHPVFNLLDANNPNMDVSTPEARQEAYSMLLSRGVFRRGGTPRADAEWELIAAEDPHGFANLNRLVHWRRASPTINFALGSATVHWDGGVTVGTDIRDGLINQANRSVPGALQGQPPTPEVVANIVDFESSLFTAQLIVPGVGRLDSGGARGGPEALASMPKVAGRFDLFDAWINHGNPRRAQIARGQELFNNKANINGRTCLSCHNAANNGANINNLLFDVRVASAEERAPDLPLYTFRNKTTGETRQLTDAGQGNVTGRWNDLGRFKTPTLRALAARAPYFHNGIAPTLDDVVRHYERRLGFVFTKKERDDLVAFLNAL